jgi:hypothetical protein
MRCDASPMYVRIHRDIGQLHDHWHAACGLVAFPTTRSWCMLRVGVGLTLATLTDLDLLRRSMLITA